MAPDTPFPDTAFPEPRYSEARSRSAFLTPRQADVLAAVVRSYVGDAAPVGSESVAAVLTRSLSPASVRTTLGELAGMGLLEKPHRSAGRIPTEAGFRSFVDHLVSPAELPVGERQDLAGSLSRAPSETVTTVASRLLSERTRQLGFVEIPRLDRVVLRHVSFVRLSAERVLVVIVSDSGRAHQRIVPVESGRHDQTLLDRMAVSLCERVAGRTLHEVRELMRREAATLRGLADSLLERALLMDAAALPGGEAEPALVIATRLAALEQPEFQDPERLRSVLKAVEEAERLTDILDQILERGDFRVTVKFGSETGEPALDRCALVAAPYGLAGAPLGVLGVIGPDRMDYARVMSLVGYLSRAVTEKLCA